MKMTALRRARAQDLACAVAGGLAFSRSEHQVLVDAPSFNNDEKVAQSVGWTLVLPGPSGPQRAGYEDPSSPLAGLRAAAA